MKIVDKRGGQYDFVPTGNLYLKRDPDQDYILKFAKPKDVGMDLPVKINVDETKLTEAGETRDKLRNVMLYPNLKHYIFPDGNADDPRPFLEIPACGWAEIPTGLRVKLPDDAWGMIKARSSTNWKYHLMVEVATVDPEYTGLLGVLVYNPNNYPVRVHEYDQKTGKGDRLAQLILVPVYNVENLILVDELPQTMRASSGFGSSGTGLDK